MEMKWKDPSKAKDIFWGMKCVLSLRGIKLYSGFVIYISEAHTSDFHMSVICCGLNVYVVLVSSEAQLK